MADISAGAMLPAQAPQFHRADEIQVAFSGPAPQRRWTVLLRLLLAIPHFIVLYVLAIATEAVLIISWFAALFTGRVPRGLADFITGFLRWYIRVYAYGFLLTDRYPPFELADSDYPVRITVSPGRLNRLAVFFRIILAIPASIVASLALFGVYIASFVVWLIVLIGGTMPRPLHEALSAVFRFIARFFGYSYLLTATYPRALFGDTPGDADPATVADPALAQPPIQPAQPPVYGQPSAQPAYGEPPAQPAQYGEQPPQPAQAGYPEPGSPQPPAYAPMPGYAGAAVPAVPGLQSWRLVISRGAKRLIALFLVLGVIGWAAYGLIISLVAGNAANSANATAQVESAHATLTTAVTTYQRNFNACKQNISCITRQDSIVAVAFGAFADSVQHTSMPNGNAAAAQALLLGDTKHVQADLAQLSHQTSAASYEQLLSSLNLQGVVDKFGTDYQQLVIALTGQ